MGRERPSVGIDVSKAVLDVSSHPSGKSWQVEHNPVGINALAQELVALGQGMPLLELGAQRPARRIRFTIRRGIESDLKFLTVRRDLMQS